MIVVTKDRYKRMLKIADVAQRSAEVYSFRPALAANGIVGYWRGELFLCHFSNIEACDKCKRRFYCWTNEWGKELGV